MEIPGWKLSCYGSYTLHYTKRFEGNLFHNYIDMHKGQIKRYQVYFHITPNSAYDTFKFQVNPSLHHTRKNIEYILNKSLEDIFIESL